MAKFFPELSESHCRFINAQQMFFVGSAPNQGRVNLSPKGLNTFRILRSDRVGYLDATGSGNETAAHLAENGRVTFMFCAFDGSPLILRIYGRGRTLRPRHAEWSELRPLFGPPIAGERQLIIADVEGVQTSCGFAVPLYEYRAQRSILLDKSEALGPEGMARFWADRNTRSIDGLPTGILDS